MSSPCLHRFEAKPGDSILIEAGTVHAIGAGVLLAEIQQMSDATFRVYDWNRVGPDGKPRQLHIREAMESIDFQRGPVNPVTPIVEEIDGVGTREHLARSQYFALDRLKIRRPTTVGGHDRFTIVMGLAGSADLGPGRWSGRLDVRPDPALAGGRRTLRDRPAWRRGDPDLRGPLSA